MSNRWMDGVGPAPWARTLTLGLVALLSSGCFSYVPADIETVPPGEDVRLFLTQAGMAALDEADPDGTLLTGVTPIVQGEITRRDLDEVYVRIPITRRQVGFHSSQLGQDVRIPTGEIVQIERRELNGVGTGLIIGGSTGLAASVILFIINDARGGPTGGRL